MKFDKAVFKKGMQQTIRLGKKKPQTIYLVLKMLMVRKLEKGYSLRKSIGSSKIYRTG